jgi:hypothetical protein
VGHEDLITDVRGMQRLGSRLDVTEHTAIMPLHPMGLPFDVRYLDVTVWWHRVDWSANKKTRPNGGFELLRVATIRRLNKMVSAIA